MLFPSYFHDDILFDYDKFYHSILTIPDLAQGGRKFNFTSTFIYKEAQSGRSFARYKFKTSNEFSRRGEIDSIRTGLEKYPIYLDDKKNKVFTIFKLFQKFWDPDNIPGDKWPLKKQKMLKYFNEGNYRLKENIQPIPQNNDEFKRLEIIYVNLLMGDLKIEKAYYMPLPIIAFGNLVGMIYLLYEGTSGESIPHDDEKDRSDNIRFLSIMILHITREYERNILENKMKIFNLKPEDPLEIYKEVFFDLGIDYKFFFPFKWEDNLQPVITQNQYLQKLGYENFYRQLSHVVTKEAPQLQNFKQEKVKTAIIAIIVDSFAHNIGAHSLVALKWLFEVKLNAAKHQISLIDNDQFPTHMLKVFEEVKDRLDETMPFYSVMDNYDYQGNIEQISLLNIVRFKQEEEDFSFSRLVEKYSSSSPYSPFAVALTQPIHHFFQYLRDKSAFWSGATRDTLFSGRTQSWDQILRIFLNNSLFLGTIAHSEGINSVRFHVEVHGPQTDPQEDKPRILVGGEYAEINLNVLQGLGTPNPHNARETNGYSDYAFLRKGNNFEEINEYLKEKLQPVYLPNGIIGQHALYTLFENTLRNIKHYKNLLSTIAEEGVILYVSIQEVPFLKRMDDEEKIFQENYASIPKYRWTKNFPLYKVGVWLHHPQKLLNPIGAFVNEEFEIDKYGNKILQKFADKGSVIGAITQQLRRRVVNERGNPVLGGSSQDKVCASMLMNNRFQLIDRIDLNLVKRQYFPYVMVASEMYTYSDKRTEGFIVEDEVLHKAYNKELTSQTASKRIESYKQYVKKYIQKISDRKQQIREEGDSDVDVVEIQGTIKKYFHLWKGEKALVVNKDFKYKHENLSRFRVLAIQNYEREGKSLPFRVEGGLEDKKNSAEYYFRSLGLIRLVEAESGWDRIEKGDVEGQNQKLYEKAMLKWMGTWLGNTEQRKGVVIFKEAQDNLIPVWGLYLRGGQIETIPYDELDEDNVYTALGIEPAQNGVGISTYKLLEVDHAYIQPIIIQHSATAKAPNPYAFKIRSHTSFFTYIFDGYEKRLGSEGFGHENFMEAEIPKQLDSPLKLLETVLTHITFFDNRIFERFRATGNQMNGLDVNAFWKQLRVQAYPEEPSLFRELRDPDKENQLLSKHHHFIVIHLSFIETIYRSHKYQDGKGSKDKYKESDVLEFFTEEIEAFISGTLPANIILVITSGRGRGEWFQETEHPQITFRPIEALLSAIEDGISLKDDFQIKYNLCNILFGS